MLPDLTLLSWTVAVLALVWLVATLPFQPLAALRQPALRLPWVVSLVLLVLLWALQARLPGGAWMSLSGASLLVLMFGWPLALWSLLGVAAISSVMVGLPLEQTVQALWWRGLLPATLALVIGLATRRWLPHHLFVYILARGFIGTALAVSLAASLEIALAPGWNDLSAQDRWVAHWLMAWGEATATGMLVAVFVAFKPQWLLTYSDLRYLPRRGD